MKKMMKIAAASLCLTLAVTTLCACSGSGNSNPSEEPSITTEEEVTNAPTSEPTEEPSTEPEAQAEIIPLWNSMTVDDSGLTIDQLLSETPPAVFFQTDFVGGIGRYWFWSRTDRKVSGNTLYHLDLPMYTENIVLSDPGTENAERVVDIYFVSASDNSVVTYFDADGSSATTEFLPLFYNTGNKCLAGYWMNAGMSSFVELYWNTNSESYICIEPEDPGLYGL